MAYINQVSVTNSTGTEVVDVYDKRLATVATVARTGKYSDLDGKPAVDGTVTASGANAVTGAAVAAYVDSVLGGAANGSY